ncbi:hypothetical protein HK102_005148 [Quaeritorhiza haematococci]|nr:hypothetical protein HK102_005148 [Quaeritorhiza haematococci]
MRKFASLNKLEFGKDVVTFSTFDDMSAAILKNYQTLSTSPYFGAIAWTTNPSALANATTYNIWTLRDTSGSSTTILSDQVDVSGGTPLLSTNNIALQVAIESAVISYARDPGANVAPVTVDVRWDFFQGSESGLGRSSPFGRSVGTGLDVTGWLLRVLYPLSYLPIFVSAFGTVAKEKQKKLLGPIRRMGLHESAYWVAAFIPYIPVALLAATASAGIMKAVASYYTVYDKTDFFVATILHLSFALAMAGFGLLFSGLVSRPLFINLMIGLVAAAIIVTNFVVFVPGVKGVVFLLAPWLSFGKAWTDVLYTTQPTTMYNETAPFDFGKLFNTPRIVSDEILKSIKSDDPSASYGLKQLKPAIDIYQSLPSTGETVLVLILSPIVFLLFAWYLNQAVPSEDGFSRVWYFPFTSSFWTGRQKRKEKIAVGDTAAMEQELSRETASVRVLKLSKQYKNTTAVKEFSMVMESGKVYCLLGHNGAGKTSLINMLSGVTNPTYGECFVFGYDLRQDISTIQSMMSMCPQFDILYPRMTAYQHVQFYLRFRGGHRLPRGQSLESFILSKLEEVSLANVAHRRVSGFSGGMKRRLSLILSALSEDTRIVFLDEPTTGMDPLSRRKCWKVIQEMKRNKVVVLTTHSMEEADALGDHVCIMHAGRLRASGSSLFLKNRFGKGYQLSLLDKSMQRTEHDDDSHTSNAVTGQNRSQDSVLEKWVSHVLPGSEIVSSAAGSLTVAVSRQATRHLVDFFRALREEESLEWSISNSTLEEVFLKLCAQNNSVETQESEGDGSSKSDQKLCAICSKRLAEMVTLYTRNRCKVTVPDIVCEPCALGRSEESQMAAGVIESDEPTFSDGDIHREHREAPQVRIPRLSTFAQALPSTLGLQKAKNAEERVRLLPSGAGGEDGPTAEGELKMPDGKGLVWKQIWAITLKNARLHGKEKKTNICFVILILLLNGILVYVGNMFGNIAGELDILPRAPSGCTAAFSNNGRSVSCDPRELTSIMFPKVERNPSGGSPFSSRQILGVCDPGVDGLDSCAFKPGFTGFSAYDRGFGAFGTSMFGSLPEDANQPLAVLTDGAPRLLAWLDEPAGASPNFVTFLGLAGNLTLNTTRLAPNPPLFAGVGRNIKDTFNAAQANLAGRKTPLPSNCRSIFEETSGVQVSSMDDFVRTLRESYPDFGMQVSRLNVPSTSAAVDVAYDMITYPGLETKKQFTPIYLTNATAVFGDLARGLPGGCIAVAPNVQFRIEGSRKIVTTAVTAVSNAVLRTVPATGANAQARAVAGNVRRLPTIVTEDTPPNSFAQLANIIILIIAILATSLMFPRLVNTIVVEKSENLYEMMRIQGLKVSQYWLGNLLYGFTVVFIFTMISYGVTFAIGISQFVKAGAGLVFITFTVYAYSQVGMAFFVASLFSKPITSSLVSYLLVLGSAAILPVFLLSNDKSGALPLPASLFPPLGFASAMNVLMLKTGSLTKGPFIGILVMNFLVATGLGLFGCYIHAVRPSKIGIPVDPLLGLTPILKNAFGCGGRRGAGRRKDAESSASNGDDEDVLEEERKVRELHEARIVDGDEAVRIVGLRKVFGQKVAVDDMTLQVRNGEAFGMLGPNGAGKTTTLSMLTGLLKPTSGTVMISGRSLEELKGELWRVVGVTPQFDTVWKDLTVEEHLQFYSRLRGASGAETKGWCRRIAEEVGLDGDALRMNASQLSGGMRRRLSIGIALTASPRILVLDEPTTGLDPETRRQIWKIIDKIKKNKDRCVIVTTHSMEEADALCTRLGIVCDGRLRVLGSQVHLKHKYGDGLKLTLRLQVKAMVHESQKEDTLFQHLSAIQAYRVQQVDRSIRQMIAASSFSPPTQYHHHHHQPPHLPMQPPEIKSSDIRIACANALAKRDDATARGEGTQGQKEVPWLLTLQYVLPRGSVDVAELFSRIGEVCDACGVVDWAFNETTLEDVFIRISEKYERDT